MHTRSRAVYLWLWENLIIDHFKYYEKCFLWLSCLHASQTPCSHKAAWHVQLANLRMNTRVTCHGSDKWTLCVTTVVRHFPPEDFLRSRPLYQELLYFIKGTGLSHISRDRGSPASCETLHSPISEKCLFQFLPKFLPRQACCNSTMNTWQQIMLLVL